MSLAQKILRACISLLNAIEILSNKPFLALSFRISLILSDIARWSSDDNSNFSLSIHFVSLGKFRFSQSLTSMVALQSSSL